MSFLILMLSGTMVMLSLIAVDPESFDWQVKGSYNKCVESKTILKMLSRVH